MDITVNITPADVSAFNRYVLSNRRGTAERILGMILWTMIGFSLMKYFFDNPRDHWELLGWFGFGFFAASFYIQYLFTRINRFKVDGSKNAELPVRFSPLGLNDLEARELREILDESGIIWRVLVISACYSGSFIEHLRTPNTLILTAAAKDRTSFGCSNTRDYTYFGEAYFGWQLQHHDSFIEAFYAARDEIKVREQQENLTPSNPQIVIGSEIEAKLNEFQRRIGL